jgi:hypothetical protein
MTSVLASITLKSQSVPADPPPSGNIRYQLKQGAVVVSTQTVALPSAAAQFAGVPDGQYTVEAQRMSTADTPVGSPATSAPFSVVAMTQTDVPDVVSVTL